MQTHIVAKSTWEQHVCTCLLKLLFEISKLQSCPSQGQRPQDLWFNAYLPPYYCWRVRLVLSVVGVCARHHSEKVTAW
eukprot:1214126-Amphidinium_carterae.1